MIIINNKYKPLRIQLYLILFIYLFLSGHAVAQLVEALCYKPKGRGFESQWGGFFQFT
jgi:hypothetical protein